MPLPIPELDAHSEQLAQRIAQIVLEGLAGRPITDAILTRPEARAYVKRRSEAAFCAWCKRWGIRPRDRGRYSRLALDRALEREARAGRRGPAVSRLCRMDRQTSKRQTQADSMGGD